MTSKIQSASGGLTSIHEESVHLTPIHVRNIIGYLEHLPILVEFLAWLEHVSISLERVMDSLRMIRYLDEVQRDISLIFDRLKETIPEDYQKIIAGISVNLDNGLFTDNELNKYVTATKTAPVIFTKFQYAVYAARSIFITIQPFLGMVGFENVYDMVMEIMGALETLAVRDIDYLTKKGYRHHFKMDAIKYVKCQHIKTLLYNVVAPFLACEVESYEEAHWLLQGFRAYGSFVVRDLNTGEATRTLFDPEQYQQGFYSKTNDEICEEAAALNLNNRVPLAYEDFLTADEAEYVETEDGESFFTIKEKTVNNKEEETYLFDDEDHPNFGVELEDKEADPDFTSIGFISRVVNEVWLREEGPIYMETDLRTYTEGDVGVFGDGPMGTFGDGPIEAFDDHVGADTRPHAQPHDGPPDDEYPDDVVNEDSEEYADEYVEAYADEEDSI